MLRGRRHEARAPRAAGARAPALLLHRAARAHPGPCARARCTSSTGSASARPSGPDDYLAYYRRLRRRFLDAVENGARRPTRTRSTTAALCDFLALCKERGSDDDHLSLVAGISRTQVERLDGARDHDARGARRRTPETTVPKLRAETLRRSSAHQAELQLHRRRTGEHAASICSRSSRSAASRSCPSRARATSGSTSRATRGSSRRAGSSTSSAGSTSTTTASRATTASGRATATQEKARLRAARRPDRRAPPRASRACTSTTTRRTSAPRSARLMGEHGTREDELDDLLRGEVLVDLYRVVAPGAARSRCRATRSRRSRSSTASSATAEVARRRRVASSPSRSGSRPASDVAPRGDPRLQRGGLPSRSTSSTAGCSSSGRRSSRGARRPRSASVERGDGGAARRARRACAAELLAGAEEGDPRWLLAQLLEYHRREEKPQWWEYFHHLSARRGGAARGRATRSAASSSSASRCRTSSRSSTRSRSRRRSTRSAARRSTRRPSKSYRRRRSTTSTALVTLRRGDERGGRAAADAR